MKVADAMTPRSDVVTAELPGTRDDALVYLQEQSFSSVPVVKQTDAGEEFRGLISRKDLIENRDEDQLAMLMRDVPTTTQATTIEELADLMVRENARRVPVVDGTLEGIITVTDVVRAIANGDTDARSAADGSSETAASASESGEDAVGGRAVGDVASHDVNTVYVETPLPAAERELYYANVPYGVVLDGEGEMTGMFTEVDILEVARVVEGEDETGESIANEDDDWMWEGIKAVGNTYLPTRNVEIPSAPVGDFMTGRVVTINRNATVREAAQTMITDDIEQIPMVNADQLVGIVRDVDLLEALR